MIWGVPLPQNGHWNSTYILKKNKYILKKNKYILKKNKYIFSKGSNPNHPYDDIYFFGDSRKVIWVVLPLQNGFWKPMYISKKNKDILHKNKYIFLIEY